MTSDVSRRANSRRAKIGDFVRVTVAGAEEMSDTGVMPLRSVGARGGVPLKTLNIASDVLLSVKERNSVHAECTPAQEAPEFLTLWCTGFLMSKTRQRAERRRTRSPGDESDLPGCSTGRPRWNTGQFRSLVTAAGVWRLKDTRATVGVRAKN
ncbi:hypothetical protein [Streptomyces chrestomyceticus]|uniref:hypothetical protein n=1 Tax=Streptomyces chrestomyceticus TaxID=68185 RepID=UPI003798DC39